MIKRYFNLPLRSILKQGRQVILSTIGLAIALSCSILILLYIEYELSYDKFHKNADAIYKILHKQSSEYSYMGVDVFAVTPGPLKTALVNDIPEVKNATKCKLNSHTLEYNSNLFSEGGFLYADPDFLKIFTFPVIIGNADEILREPFALFMTKEMCYKYFGNENPIGKMIKVDNKFDYTVKGILEDIPANTHLDFDFLTGMETLYSIRGKEKVETWPNFTYITYVQLNEGVKTEQIKDKLNNFTDKYLPKKPLFQGIKWIPEPLTAIHLGGNANFEPNNNSDIKYIFLVSSIGIFILLIACFNYMNMATARSYSRGKEIGILKVIGSIKAGLTLQLVIESLLLSFIALIIALLIVWFVLPVFAGFTQRPLTYRMIFEYSMLIKIVALILFVGIFAGLYPAFRLASYSPLNLIKQNFSNFNGKATSQYLRNTFVVIQYIISIVALVSTFTILGQLNFIKNKDMGFTRNNIINISLKDPLIKNSPEILINEFQKNPKILEITTSSHLPGSFSSLKLCYWESKPEDDEKTIYIAAIGPEFIPFYNLKIIAGRGFSPDFKSDTLSGFIINQTAARMMGWDDPIGKKFAFNPKEDEGTIIGVVEDFNYQSLNLKIEPLCMVPIGNSEYKRPNYISIKVNPEYLTETTLFVYDKLKELSPNYLNPVSLLSDQIDNMYNSDKKLAAIILFSTILAMILTCIGQYSLSSYTTKKRTKEMAIRKVNGAKPINIMSLLTGDVLKLVLIAVLFAWPVSYYIITKWLQNFAFRIDIGLASFIYSFLITLLISLIVISSHVIKLSRVNPAEVIRYE